MPNTISKFPEVFTKALDEVLVTSSYAARYSDPGAEFVNAKTVNVPDITFASDTVNDYDGFKTKNDVTLSYTPYTLEHDKQASFDIDAVQDIDTAAILSTKAASEYQHTIFLPAVDKDFFKTAAAKAKTTGSEAITKDNIKAEIRKARTQFTEVGLSGGDLYMSSTALAALEDAVDRQFSNETNIIDTVGSYDGFTIFEVPQALLGENVDFIVISGGKNTIHYIVKRAVAYLFAPGTHVNGDCWLSQFRWVFGSIVKKNKKAGIYVNKHA